MNKVKVLFLAADPLSYDGDAPRLRLDDDVRAIREKVRAAEFRHSLDFDVRWAVRPDDLIQAFNETRPEVVHFSGHGSKTGLVLVGEDGSPRTVSAPALAKVFRIFGSGVRVVMLNACYSRAQAEAIVQFVDCAIGTPGSIPDAAAITFGASFYRAIAFGRSVQEAFEQASVMLEMGGVPPETCPVLLLREGVDPARVVIVSRSAATERQFLNVAYARHSFGLFHYRVHDVGTLSIEGSEAVFRGENEAVHIAGITDVSHGRQSGDPFANWVKVRYGDQRNPSVAYFARQTALSSLVGGSDDLLIAFQSMLQATRAGETR